MSLIRRHDKGNWIVQFTTPNGERIQRSTGTQDKRQAQELHDRLKAQLWREQRLGVTPVKLWEDAAIRWLEENAHKKSLRNDETNIAWLHPYFGGLELCAITRERIEKAKKAKLKEGVSNGTVNRILALIRAILNTAKNDWEWLETVPTIKLLPETKLRERWLTHEDVELLVAELPAHLVAMLQFTLATGLRESNVTQLQWSQVDMQRRCAWIHADQAKAGKAIAVPLNDDALSVVRSQIGKHPDFVFTYKGKPVTRANNHAWRNALKRAGIENFRWHDLRHTWASWHIQSGTPINALKELGGWSDLKMVERYAHLSTHHLAGYANNIATKGDANPMQAIKSPADEKRSRA